MGEKEVKKGVSHRSNTFEFPDSVKNGQDLLKSSLIDLAPLIVLGIGVNSEIVVFNRQAEIITGYKKSEVFGKRWIDLCIPKRLRKTIYSVLADIVKGNLVSHQYENEIITKSGNERIIHWNSTVLTGKDKKFELLLAIGEDITEKEKTRLALESSEKNYRNLLDISQDIIIVISRSGKMLFANKRAISLLGYSEKEIFSAPITRFLASGSVKKALAAVAKEFLGHVQPALEFELKAKDGTGVFVETSVGGGIIKDTTFLGGKNDEVAILVSAHDITERKKLEERLRLSEEMARSLIRYSPEAIVVFDMSSEKFVDVNLQAEKMFKLSQEDFLKKDATDISPKFQPDGRLSSVAVKAYSKRAASGENPVFEWMHKSSDGALIPCEVRLIRLPSEKGTLIRGSMVDITERKKQEEALRQNEMKYRSLFDSMSEGVALHELICNKSGTPVDYGLIEVNKSFEKLTGLNAKEVVGRLATKVYGTKEAPFIDIYAKVVKTGKPVVFDHYFAPFKKYYSISVFSPAKMQFATLFSDISAEKNMLEALRVTDKKFKLVSSLTGQLFYDYDLITKKVEWFGAVEEVTGYTVEKYNKSVDIPKWATLIHPDERKKAVEDRDAAQKACGKYVVDYRYLGKNGYVQIHDEGSFLRGTDGKAVRMIGVMRDISSLKKKEDELNERTNQLERFNKIAVDRELRMIELKGKIKQLEEKLELIKKHGRDIIE